MTVGSGPEVPRYGFEPPTTAPRRARLRQAALLVLMALACSLIFVLPEPNEDGYALSSDQESTIQIGPTDAATGVQRLGGSEGADEGDELALASGGNRSQDIVGGVGDLPIETEAETDGPGDDGEHNLAAGIAEMAALAMVPSAPAVTETTESPTTTTAPVETAAETTATTEVETTTSGPATTAAASGDTSTDAEATDTTVDGQASTEDDAASAADGQNAGAEDGTGDSGDGTEAGDGGEPSDPTTTTTEPEPPVDTQPPETTPEPEPVDPAWVDAGNGVLVPPVLVAIRYCESRGDYTAANPSSTARGAYQFLTGSWDYYGHKARYGVNQAHLATPAQQDEAALMTWERDGTRPWNASRSCWSQRI